MRLRLTFLYGAVFVASGAALLGITYELFRRATGQPVVVSTQTRTSSQPGTEQPGRPLPSLGSPHAQAERDRQLAQQEAERRRAVELSQLLLQSGIALTIMTLVSIGLGWLLAGRVLSPLRTITTRTRAISQKSLHARLALDGPRDELKQLADTIDELLARLESAFEARGRFVANAAHELRTPLAMMRTSIDVAAGKPGEQPPQLRALDAKLRTRLDESFHGLWCAWVGA